MKSAPPSCAPRARRAPSRSTACRRSWTASRRRHRPIGRAAERVHVTVTAAAPELSPKTWYGMPAYVNADGKIAVFFQNAGKFGYRYSTLGFRDAANLDDGDVWPVSYALNKWSPIPGRRGKSGDCGPGRRGAGGSRCSECPRDNFSITLSDEEGQGERAQCRRFARAEDQDQVDWRADRSG
jgi:hypothetical protein